jgi:glycine/D-amino acid oxidase-like deaminating enzyme
MAIVILGTGIIGLSTAYSLSASSSTPPSSIHLVDASPTLFSSASGFAGGFLAKDWFADELASLGELSFELHRKLASANDGGRRWGYVASRAMSLVKKMESTGKKVERGDDWLRRGTSRADAAVGTGEEGKIGGMEWLKTGQGDVVEGISEAGTTAQV